MGSRDPRVDAYIGQAQPFAQPILRQLRDWVHGACPAVMETIKWGFPHFEHHGLLCSMAAFKAHCAFGFWKREGIVEAASTEAMGQLGRIASLKDLPEKTVFAAWVKKAAAQNESGEKPARAPKTPRAPLEVPDAFLTALRANARALATFERFSPSHQREYVEWYTEAKTEATRERRLAQAVEWMAEGKPRNWKYQNG